MTHADAGIGQSIILPIDVLDPDEQSAVSTLNGLLLATGNKPVVVDTAAQETARLDASQEVVACALAPGNAYERLAGANATIQTNVGSIGFDASWAVDIPTPPTGVSTTAFAGAAALYQIPDCNAGGVGKIANYYDLELIAPYH